MTVMRKCQLCSPQLQRSFCTSESALRRVALIGFSVDMSPSRTHLPDVAAVAFNFAVFGVEHDHIHVTAGAVALR